MERRGLPPIEQLAVARVTQVPEWHPEHATFEPFPVHVWLVRHPDGPVLVDTGIGPGHALVDAWYRPEVIPLHQALAAVGVGTDEVAAVVLSHLHFDHCGQQLATSGPVYVQADEHVAAQASGYTVPEWADIAPARLRLVHGDEEILDGITVIATPGHTPGHQSVLVHAGDDRVVLAAQCAFHGDELRAGSPSAANLHDPSWQGAAADSLARVRALHPRVVNLSHDAAVRGSDLR
jgi:N-acyl homoserine lactone hydrolase